MEPILYCKEENHDLVEFLCHFNMVDQASKGGISWVSVQPSRRLQQLVTKTGI